MALEIGSNGWTRLDQICVEGVAPTVAAVAALMKAIDHEQAESGWTTPWGAAVLESRLMFVVDEPFSTVGAHLISECVKASGLSVKADIVRRA